MDRIFDFSDELKNIVGIPPDRQVPPFAVISSNKTSQEAPWPIREYAWGTCEAFNSQHSDFSYLKKLLLEEGFCDIRESTEKR